jgi:hypothetical protein
VPAEQRPTQRHAEVDLLKPGQRCGEGCGEGAAVMIDGLYTYCWPCLARLVRLGTVFEAAMAEARDA